MTQAVKVLAPKPDNMSSILRTHRTERRQPAPASHPPHTCCTTHMFLTTESEVQADKIDKGDNGINLHTPICEHVRTHNFKQKSKLGEVAPAFNPSTLEAETGRSEFEASLLDRGSSRSARNEQLRPYPRTEQFTTKEDIGLQQLRNADNGEC